MNTDLQHDKPRDPGLIPPAAQIQSLIDKHTQGYQNTWDIRRAITDAVQEAVKLGAATQQDADILVNCTRCRGAVEGFAPTAVRLGPAYWIHRNLSHPTQNIWCNSADIHEAKRNQAKASQAHPSND